MMIYGLFDLMFFIVPLFMILVIGFFIYSAIKESNYNNRQPIIPVEAKVIGKRTHVSGGGNNHSASTTYFITFELTNGERLELKVLYNEYGYIMEGDRGILTFQGRRFKDFKRN